MNYCLALDAFNSMSHLPSQWGRLFSDNHYIYLWYHQTYLRLWLLQVSGLTAQQLMNSRKFKLFLTALLLRKGMLYF